MELEKVENYMRELKIIGAVSNGVTDLAVKLGEELGLTLENTATKIVWQHVEGVKLYKQQKDGADV